MTRLFWFSLALLAGCPRESVLPDAGADAGLAPDVPIHRTCDSEDATQCAGFTHERCVHGVWTELEHCSVLCDDALGCIDCVPDSRTCVDGNVRACTGDGTVGAVLETCAAETPCSGGYCGGCAADTDLVYLIDVTSHLFSFDPRTQIIEDRGHVDCSRTLPSARPYSMAVDRMGRAWVLYDDGELFFVDIADASCTASGFVPDQDRFHTFGMGFSSTSMGGTETLYIAGGPDLSSADGDTRLAIIDQGTLEVNAIAPLTTLGPYYPELTGDGEGGLYGYFPSDTHPTRISTLRAATATIGPTWDAVPVDPGTSIATWAFARWGGAFYVFVGLTEPSSGGMLMNSDIYRLDPETGALTYLQMDRHNFVGAGVSTCAPLVF